MLLYLLAKFTLIIPACWVGVEVDGTATGVVGRVTAPCELTRPDLLGVAGVLPVAR